MQYSEKTIDECLHYYKDLFFRDTNWIQLRVARKNNKIQQLNWRSEIYQQNLHCAPILERVFAGIRTLNPGIKDHEKYNALISELGVTFPSSGIAVDFDPKDGFTKLWHWGRYNIVQFVKLKNAPPSILNYLPLFAEQGVSALYCVGVDYTKKSMNVYFDWKEKRHYKDIQDVVDFLEKIGFSIPSEDYLASMARAACLACTFRWDSPTIERCCFYMDHWTEVSENLENFKEECALPTTLSSEPSTFVSCSVGERPDMFYTKLESDYYRTYADYISKIGSFHFATNTNKSM